MPSPMNDQERKKWRILYAPSLKPAELSVENTETVNNIIEAVGPRQALSEQVKKQLWGAIQQSKASRQSFAILYRHRKSAADLKLLKTIKVRCSEVKRLLRKYTVEKTLSNPTGGRVDLAVHLATLDEIEAAAQATMLRETNWSGFTETLDEWYAGGLLADIYEATFKKQPTPSMPANGPGPFIRFVLAVYRVVGLPEPAPASVRTWRLRFLKKRGQALGVRR